MRGRLPLTVCVIATLAGLTDIPPSNAQAPLPPIATKGLPPVMDIIDRVVARAQTQDEAGAELWFESLVATTVDSLDGEDDIVETETTLHRRYPLEGAVYEELVERNGRPLDDDERAEEAARRDAFRREARAARARDERMETNDERQVRFDQSLISRYRAELTGEESVRGERCWVIRFEPRDGRLPAETRLDRALNRSAGVVYVSQRDHGIVRVEFNLLGPVRYLWGLVASLRTASGRLDFERVDTNVWLPDVFDMRIDLRILFRTTRQHIVRDWVERMRLDDQALDPTSSVPPEARGARSAPRARPPR